MVIEDRIFGEMKIEDPLIIEIISTKAFQRLKNINQYGGVNFVYPDQFQTTRYEHSIGVWHILKTLNTSLEIQVNGLLHDLGHMAFSHMVDQAKEESGENYHEKFIHQIEGYDEVVQILERSKLPLKNVDNYPEIKLSLPDIGADRLDYGIRDYSAAKENNDLFGKKVLENIKLVNRKIIFTNLDTARKYGERGTQAMWEVIYNPKVAVVYQTLINSLKQGFNEGWLNDEDLIKDDNYMLQKFREHIKDLRIFDQEFEVEQVDCKLPHDLKHVKLKVRYFDPLIEIDGEIKRVSEIDSKFKDFLAEIVPKFERRIQGECFKVIYS